ncbi:MAG TPA: tetratricopeptide repeat protein [Rhizomicrobium sp.]|nr:tetratricopeptide repeat protein [Rhizomicrobium sp.]
MRALALGIFVVLTLSGAAIADGSGGGGNNGSADSGGERPFNGNVFRQDEMNQQLDPEGTSPYETGLNLLKDRKYREAIPHLTAAAARKPNDAAAWFYLGYAHHQLAESLGGGDERETETDTAMRNYRHALTLDPNIKAAHEYLGLLYLRRQDRDAAQGQAKALARLCPSSCEERARLDRALSGNP